jgi:hypothetical protein
VGFGYFRLSFTWVLVAGMEPDHPRADVIGWHGEGGDARDKGSHVFLVEELRQSLRIFGGSACLPGLVYWIG